MGTLIRSLAITAAFVPAMTIAGQRPGVLPWKKGDRSPTVAGLRLGASRTKIDSVLGKPASVQEMGPGVVALNYPARGIVVVYSDGDSLAILDLRTREAGDIAGVRVGDTRLSLFTRWGNPTTGEDTRGLYIVGRWVIAVQLTDDAQRIKILSLGRLTDTPIGKDDKIFRRTP